MTEEQNKGLAERIELTLDLNDSPRLSINQWKQIITALRRELDPVLGECEECGHTIVTPLKRFPEREPATDAVLEMAAKVAIRMADAASARLQQSHDDDAAAQFDTANEIAEAIRALKGKGASQGVGEMSEIREVLEWTRALLRNIVKASPEVRKHTDVEAFILNEINPSLALCARITCVPTIPTKAMIKAGRDATKYASGGTVETIYRAMLAASPDEQKG